MLAAVCWLATLAGFAADAPGKPPGIAPSPFISIVPPTPNARVVVTEDPGATRNFEVQPEVVRRMVRDGLLRYTGRATEAEGWRTLVQTQDVVGIKVWAGTGLGVGTRPAVVEAVVEGLLAAGLPQRNIVIWDKQWSDLRDQGFVALADRLGVRAVGAQQAGWDADHHYDSSVMGVLGVGDRDFLKPSEPNNDVGRRSYLSRLVSGELTRIINVTPLLNHNEAGVSGNLFGLSMGAMDNTARFEVSSARLAVVVPEICAMPELGDKVVFNVVDGLICQYLGSRASRLQDAVPLNQLRFSTDPVALDVLSMHTMERFRENHRVVSRGLTNALPIYLNATALELGLSDTNKIQVEGP